MGPIVCELEGPGAGAGLENIENGSCNAILHDGLHEIDVVFMSLSLTVNLMVVY